MALEDEVKAARTEIVSDGYDMSIGEVMNLYRDNELKIDPAFQRLFRWDETRKTRFIESLLLGIPIPPIFVFQDEKGVWELIDGLQRLSTVFQFTGILKGDANGLTLEGTQFLPSLSGKRWEDSDRGIGDGIGSLQQLQIKRARVRVEILKMESDAKAKYELFQRLNTGGAGLTEQEVRNCIAVMVNKQLFDLLIRLSNNFDFVTTTAQTETAIEAQAGVELALRFLAFRNVAYERGLDVHEYLTNALLTMASDEGFDEIVEESDFTKTFDYLNAALGDSAFRRWDGNSFKGKFLISVFEVLAFGVSKNIVALDAMDAAERKSFLVSKAKELWNNETFKANSGGGTRGTTRLVNLLPMAEEFLKP
ncbi:DUF262 domain-containing protein [Sphingobium sp. KCTC 72723]|uniref:DUF262 domain-containing protein n=1 Tax=Sphingobium sp. KCTC 72723 TaxID=2733867 RepID=UPI00165DEBE2|nr:DUF262 domain-containing protein [Sphingobium sp. KCTC 72723]